MRQNLLWDILRDYAQIIVGAVITALGLNLFLIPNRIAAGGVSGLATVIHFLFGIPVGVMMLVFNVPLFVLSTRALGPHFGVRTLVGMGVLSMAVDLLPVPALTSDLLLATVYGGLITGLGMGLVFRAQGTTGGTDLAASLLSHYLPISVGQALLATDFFVITLAGIVFNAELAMYALLTLFLSSRVIDIVQEGLGYARAAMIVTNKPDQVAQAILYKMERGVTALQARGMYSGEQREVLYSVVSRPELARLKEIVHDLDPRAFIIIHEVHEVLGEGFKEPKVRRTVSGKTGARGETAASEDERDDAAIGERAQSGQAGRTP